MSRLRWYGNLDGGKGEGIHVLEPSDMPIELASDDDEARDEKEEEGCE